MLFAILAYHEEQKITALTPEQDAALMADLFRVHDAINRVAALGPAARLDFTPAAVTIRDGVVTDGPFAETKEQLLGFYLIDCGSLDEAVQAARDLQKVNTTAVYEVRPVTRFLPPPPAG